MTTSIRPLLSGERLDLARAEVQRIAEALRAVTAPRTPADPWSTAELALFYTYAAQSWTEYAELAQDLVERLVDEMGDATLQSTLYGGFPGMAFIYQHVTAAGEDDVAATVDQALEEALTAGWSGDYDLINGLVGLGIYALERLPTPSARRVLERVVERLVATAEEQPTGLTWRTPAHRINLVGRGDISYDLGVAHGVGGVIPLLAAALEAGIEAARAPLERSVKWLLSKRLPGDASSQFSSTIEPGQPTNSSRQAWCYGDPGLAVALHHAGRALRDQTVQEEVLQIALTAARHPVERSGVSDAGVCHGSAGLLHLYNTLYQATKQEPFAAAARRWFDNTLSWSKEGPASDLAGYRMVHAKVGAVREMERRSDGSFLTGIVGVGLALYTATSELDPGWDRLIMPRMPTDS